MAIELRTLLLSYALTNIICLVVGYVTWRTHRDRLDGLGYWVGNFALQLLGIVLLGARGYLHDLLSIVGAGGLIVSGLYLLLKGTHRFFGRQFQSRVPIAVVLVFVAVHAYFTAEVNEVRYRNINLSVVLAYFGAWIALTAYRSRTRRLGGATMLFAGTMLAFAVVNILRAVAELILPMVQYGVFAGPTAVAALLAFHFFNLAILTSLMLMVNHELVEDLRNELLRKDQTLSALREAESSLQQSQRLADQALALTHAGYWTIDLRDGHEHRTSSPRTVEIFGDPPRQSNVYNLADDWYPNVAAVDRQIADSTYAALRETVAGRASRYDVIYPYRRPADQRVIWLHAIGSVIRDAEGLPALLQGVVVDITEQREADVRQVHLVLDASPEAMLLVRKDGRIAFANKVALQLFEYELSELLGLSGVDQLTPLDVRTRHAGHRQAYLHSGMTLAAHANRTVTAVTRNGRMFTAEISLSPIVLSGEPVIIAAVSDVTERITHLQNLAELNASLEVRVAERTQALQHALQMAEEASRSRGDFLARMSHEIRTPLNAVLGMAYLGLKAKPNAMVKGYLEKIQRAGDHLMGVINDVLDFSKIDSGKLTLELNDFDLRQMLENAIQLTQTRAVAKGLTLRRELDPLLPPFVHADALRMGQIIINYLNNAIKFTDKGEVTLRVINRGNTELGQGMVRLRFEVSDTGVGLSEEQMGRLFTSFEQADTSTSRRYGGSGLGLAISKQLAQLMGGHVGVESQLGVGSTFWCELPVWKVESVIGKDRSNWVAAARIEALAGIHVLVVDDSVFNLDVARGILEQAGIQVMTATDGEQGLHLMREVSFDCVLMDMQMPVMDGLTATRLIRQDPVISSALVIGLTANAYREHHVQCLEAGMNTVLTKPIDPNRLLSTIAEYLERFGRLSSRLPPAEVFGALEAMDDPLAREAIPSNAVSPAAALSTEPSMVPKGAELPPETMEAHEPDASAEEIWAPDELAKFVGPDPGVQRRLLTRYLTEGERLCGVMAALQADADWKGMGLNAHTLKSSSKAVGAKPLAGLCQSLEHAGRDEDAALCRQLLTDIQAGFAQVKGLISARLDSPAAAATKADSII